MILPKVEVKKILYATDLSENAKAAFSYAISLANLYNAGLTILHTLTDLPDLIINYIGEQQWEEIKTRHLKDAREALIGKKKHHVSIREALQKFCEDAQETCEDAPFVTDEIIVKSGDPAEQILEQMEERNCDMIVMGSHGHGTIMGAMLGSTAQKVIRRSKKPVMLVRLPNE